MYIKCWKFQLCSKTWKMYSSSISSPADWGFFISRIKIVLPRLSIFYCKWLILQSFIPLHDFTSFYFHSLFCRYSKNSQFEKSEKVESLLYRHSFSSKNRSTSCSSSLPSSQNLLLVLKDLIWNPRIHLPHLSTPFLYTFRFLHLLNSANRKHPYHCHCRFSTTRQRKVRGRRLLSLPSLAIFIPFLQPIYKKDLISPERNWSMLIAVKKRSFGFISHCAIMSYYCWVPFSHF